MKKLNSLPDREKKFLLFGAAFLFCALLYAFVWAPMEKSRTSLQQRLPLMREELAKMRAQVREIGALKQKISPATHQDLKAAIVDSASRHGIPLSKIEIDAEGKAHAALAQASFDEWIRWLQALATENHLLLESAAVDALPEPGMVKIEARIAPWGAP